MIEWLSFHFSEKSKLRTPTHIIGGPSMQTGSHSHCLAAFNAASRSNGGPLMTFAPTTLPSVSTQTRTRTTPEAGATAGATGFTLLTAVFSKTLIETLNSIGTLTLRRAGCGVLAEAEKAETDRVRNNS